MSKRKIRRMQQRAQQSRHSKIKDHTFKSKKLLPPFLKDAGLRIKNASWIDDRLPDMLWAVLLVGNLPRERALSIFREVGDYIGGLGEEEAMGDVTHTGLANLAAERLGQVLRIIVVGEEEKKVLMPLMLFRALPGRSLWEKALGRVEEPPEASGLMRAVGRALFHQSQEATDCRWVKVLCLVLAGKAKFPSSESVQEILLYPTFGDMRKVRPSIRASELAFADMDDSTRDWPAKFWEECFSSTPCFPLEIGGLKKDVVAGTTVQRVNKVYELLVKHAYQTQHTTRMDARHDTVFGVGLYCLSILQELLAVGNSELIIGRNALRTIVECYITLSYLVKKDDVELWKSYRVFGSGQAKLAFLKLEEFGRDTSFVDLDTLNQLANEDVWQEFLPINVGHWDNTNLRKLSEVGATKAEYDRFYSWTSSFSHGHWGAIRDTVFATCGNPLHRLHRIPRNSSRACPDVIPDACEVVDKILDIISTCYPTFVERVTIKV